MENNISEVNRSLTIIPNRFYQAKCLLDNYSPQHDSEIRQLIFVILVELVQEMKHGASTWPVIELISNFWYTKIR